jgi:hypothetical protein
LAALVGWPCALVSAGATILVSGVIRLAGRQALRWILETF